MRLLHQQTLGAAPWGCRPCRPRRVGRASGAPVQRAPVRVHAVAAPEKTTTTEFRAWDSPSAKAVAKRDDLKK